MKDKLGKVFYGWWIAAAGIILMAFSYGAWYYAYGAFFTPIETEFGWSRAKTSLAFSFSRGEGGLEGVIIGPLCDKFGPRFVVRAGWTLAALGFLLMSRINSFWMFMVSYILFISLGMNAGQTLPLTAAIAQWFDKKRGLALGFLLAGGAILGALLLQGTARLIADRGWRMTNVILAIAALVLGWGMSFIIKPHGPERYGLRMDGEKTEPTEEVAKSASVEIGEKDNVVS